MNVALSRSALRLARLHTWIRPSLALVNHHHRYLQQQSHWSSFKIPSRSLSKDVGDKSSSQSIEIADDVDTELFIPKCVLELTPELRTELTGGNVAKKFKIKLLEEELAYMEKRRYPLPDSLSKEQWAILISFKDRETRTRYIDAIVTKKEEKLLPELKALDEAITKKLVFDPKDFIGLSHHPEHEVIYRVQVLEDTYNMMLQEGEMVPVTLSSKDRRILIDAYSPNKARKTLQYLAELRQIKVREIIKKRIRQKQGRDKKAERLKEQEVSDHLIYGLGQNIIFMRIDSRQISPIEDWRVMRELMPWGQPLIIDLQFMNAMNLRQARSLMQREIVYGLNRNKQAKEPFAIYLTSFDKHNEKCRYLLDFMPNLLDSTTPVVVTEKSYLEVFPKERLVYLTPDSRTDLNEYDGNDIYVIGGLIDSFNEVARTLAVAKKDGVRHARLPLRKHIG